MAAMSRSALLAVTLLVASGCDGTTDGASQADVPSALASCAQCHQEVVERFLGHGMSDTLGPLRQPPSGSVQHDDSGDLYRFVQEGEATLLTHERPDGGLSRQLVVGRLGAGVFDTSFIGSALDDEGRPTGRLSFLPVEEMVGHGLLHSPFEAMAPGTGFGMPFTAECLSCHTNQAVASLPGAASGSDGRHIWPAAQLGTDALLHLQPLLCDACHGPTEQHAELMTASLQSGRRSPELGLVRLAQLPAARQRDICARCHLQGEGQILLEQIAAGGPQPDDFLSRRPVLVPANPGDDFRFVDQLRRLTLSACFIGTEDMTCLSCHAPHSSVRAQGTASFDARCMACHDDASACMKPAELSTRAVTGEPARSAKGCVDCHVRRSQPFDLPAARTVDHWVRRRIAKPATTPVRAWEDPDGPLEVFDDGRLSARLASAGGARWEQGLVALGLQQMGRLDEALAILRSATDDAAPALPPLDTVASVRFVRGLIHEAAGDAAGALLEYNAALALDPGHPGARLNRGALQLAAGDSTAALADAAELLSRYPRAEQPWNLRARAAATRGDLPAAIEALVWSLDARPDDAAVWREVGRLLLAVGRNDEAAVMLERAAQLQPSLLGLQDDLAAARR
jgi:Flp pilus assembly protein TadD